jgi:hypothetical protein
VKWQNDEDKLTFIILARQPDDQLPDKMELTTLTASVPPEDPRVKTLSMVGDVNLFLKGPRPNSALSASDTIDKDIDFEVEIEIMIAGNCFLSYTAQQYSGFNINTERTYWRKGFALESILLLLGYATGKGLDFLSSIPSSGASSFPHLDLRPYLEYIQTTQAPYSLTSIITPDRLVVRISDSNEASIHLFERLGFEIVKRVEVFQEVEMRWRGPR